jgi:NADPH:quinone reductase-like Zn-dependent oxidoreductase
MQVAEVSEFGGPEVLHLAERPDPAPAPGDVVVRIRAANVNPTDLATRAGVHSPPGLELPYVPGWDLAGAVTATGGEVDGFSPGDRVVGMIPFGRIGGRVGAYAQAAAVDPAWLAPLPGEVDDAIAATLALNALTARQALDLIGVPPGSTLLVTGASGAVGGFATQLAARAGLRVLAQASHDDAEWVGSLGATEVLARDADLAGIGPVDALLDAVPLGPASAACLRDGGIAVFTRPPGAEPSGAVRFETVRVQPDSVALTALAEDLCAGRLRTRVAEVLPLAAAARAHALAQAGGLRGKVVLAP